MSGRIFQNSVLQFKETTDRTIGVIDAEGTVIACSELTAIGKRWSKYVEPIVSADGTCVALEGKCFKALPSWGNTFDYAVFATGDDSMSRTVCSMAAVALNAAKNYYEEKHDKDSFIKNIISDNILISDIYMRAKELHVDAEVARGVFVVRPVDDRLDTVPVDVVQGLFPDRQNDFVLSVGEHDVALIHQMGEDATAKDMEEVALRIEEALRADGESRVFVGIGTLALHLRDLSQELQRGPDRHRGRQGVRYGALRHQLRKSGYWPADLSAAYYPVRDVPAGGVQEEPHRCTGPRDAVHHLQVL